MEWLVDFYRRTSVELVCSLPCYTAENADRQRGAGVFDKSIAALQKLNAAGFGRGELRLDLVYNPIGASLPPPQAGLEAQYRDELARNFGVVFDRLLTITNMPIARFANQLHSRGKPLGVHEPAGQSLQSRDRRRADVPRPGERRMGRAALRLRLQPDAGNSARRHAAATIWDIDDVGTLAGARIATGSHCFGCTAGAGSSCGGAIA